MKFNPRRKVDIHLDSETVLSTTCEIGCDVEGRIAARSVTAFAGPYMGELDGVEKKVFRRFNFENTEYVTINKTELENLEFVIECLASELADLEREKIRDPKKKMSIDIPDIFEALFENGSEARAAAIKTYYDLDDILGERD